ncbi:hypothetical protein A2774_05875 [Candidatus Roizmanbacteria bacterium RIFCSPHIGHO2_01_FULL_39_12c]|uniref:PIN domain-containing protein n=1 Tax=Candidatus Roizmanbacteria bacterium RIFCSPHIGHO2_01_FULL_39_12c TaxID=1802031 RepID=A0A1F7GAD6_9BACT|nr:MAG: hypothetical protein A2774_05875 [Candidatus Roizmanbacteria bacterium RIFCSPHIGHO2_01_FULL_39_12c]OGK46461.1 MAG: hypothetical protein A2963_01690 [Candidatus Roizmanbacteria bacterium RIFCSPLOWO2_01_FULL_40_13]
MKYLLDTHIFLWWLEDNKKLKQSLYKIIESPENDILISAVTAWEISIKQRAGKLKLTMPLEEAFGKYDFEILNISFNHILMLGKLPLHHRDPFDRLLIAQAQSEKLTLITLDKLFKKYKVKLLL